MGKVVYLTHTNNYLKIGTKLPTDSVLREVSCKLSENLVKPQASDYLA